MNRVEGSRSLRPGRAAGQRASAIVLCGLVALATGCGTKAEVPAPGLSIPEAAAVRIVKVDILGADGALRGRHQIDTRPRVEALMAALAGHQRDSWRTMISKRPQELSVSFETTDSLPLILVVGPDWLGGYDTIRDEKGRRIGRWRALLPGEHERLLGALREEGADAPLRLPSP